MIWIKQQHCAAQKPDSSYQAKLFAASLDEWQQTLMEAIAQAVEAIGSDYTALVGAAAVIRLRDCLLTMLRRLGISVFA